MNVTSGYFAAIRRIIAPSGVPSGPTTTSTPADSTSHRVSAIRPRNRVTCEHAGTSSRSAVRRPRLLVDVSGLASGTGAALDERAALRRRWRRARVDAKTPSHSTRTPTRTGILARRRTRHRRRRRPPRRPRRRSGALYERSSTPTQTLPSPTTTSLGRPPTSISSVTRPVAGSIRLTVPSSSFATHTAPAPAATPAAPRPTGIVLHDAVRRRVDLNDDVLQLVGDPDRSGRRGDAARRVPDVDRGGQAPRWREPPQARIGRVSEHPERPVSRRHGAEAPPPRPGRRRQRERDRDAVTDLRTVPSRRRSASRRSSSTPRARSPRPPSGCKRTRQPRRRGCRSSRTGRRLLRRSPCPPARRRPCRRGTRSRGPPRPSRSWSARPRVGRAARAPRPLRTRPDRQRRCRCASGSPRSPSRSTTSRVPHRCGRATRPEAAGPIDPRVQHHRGQPLRRARRRTTSATTASTRRDGAMRRGSDAESGARVRDQLRARVVSLLPVARDRAREDRVDLAGQLRRVPARRSGLLLEMREDRRDVRRAPEWKLARQRLVEHAAERVDVGAAVDRIAADLLRGRRSPPCP